MRISSRMIINIRLEENEFVLFPLNDREWRDLVGYVLSLGGMVYVEPPKFSDVYVCHTITLWHISYIYHCFLFLGYSWFTFTSKAMILYNSITTVRTLVWDLLLFLFNNLLETWHINSLLQGIVCNWRSNQC